jgi:deoxyribose-phosphate aldolase
VDKKYANHNRSMTLPEKIKAAVSHFKDFRSSEICATGPLPAELSQFIDHTLLKPDAVTNDILKICSEAETHGFKTVCVNSGWIPLCRDTLSTAIPIAVIGFPLGAGLTEAKSAEARMAIGAGAREIDMVLHVGRLREGNYEYVFSDIKSVFDTCGRIPLKVILETSLLTYDEIVTACVICREVGVAFVKTSTGFGGGGATVEHVALMKAAVGKDIQVKASGGIRTYEDAVKMYNAGARRIGASASVAIVTKQL